MKNFEQTIRTEYPDITFIQPGINKDPDSIPEQALLLGDNYLVRSDDNYLGRLSDELR